MRLLGDLGAHVPPGLARGSTIPLTSLPLTRSSGRETASRIVDRPALRTYLPDSNRKVSYQLR